MMMITMRPTKTANPLRKFVPQSTETLLWPGFCANILDLFEARFQRFVEIYSQCSTGNQFPVQVTSYNLSTSVLHSRF